MNNDKKAYVKFEDGKLFTSNGEEVTLEAEMANGIEKLVILVRRSDVSIEVKLRYAEKVKAFVKRCVAQFGSTYTADEKEQLEAVLSYVQGIINTLKKLVRSEADYDWSTGCKGFAKKTSTVAVNCAEVVIDVLVVVFDALLGLVVTLVTSVWASLKKLFNTITNTFKFNVFKS